MPYSPIFYNKLLYPLLGLFFLTACMQQDDQTNNPMPTDSKIAVSHCCNPSFAFMEEVLTELQESSKAIGLDNSLIIKRAEEQQQKQLQQVSALLADNPDVLLLANQYGKVAPDQHQKLIFDMANEKNIPVILYVIGAKPVYQEEYKNLYYVGFIPSLPAIHQGQAIVKHWKQHPEWDLNNDGIIQYAIIKGIDGNPYAEDRTSWVQATIKNYPKLGIKGESVSINTANFSRAEAKTLVEKWQKTGIINKAEVIIANSDEMALGAVDALKPLNIKRPIYGVDGLPEAIEAVKTGEMAGTVLQNPKDLAKETINLATNLVANRPLTTGTELKVVDRKLVLPAISVDRDNVDQFSN